MAPARALVVLLALSACATAPAPKPETAPRARAVTPDGTPIQRASAPAGPAEESARIGQADLARARTLLSEARNELEPRQWELLDNKLTEAERAFERFNRAVRASGRAAEVARGTEGVAEAERASEAGKGIRAGSRLGPLLALLILFWPSETADPAHDHGPEEWLGPELEFRARLQELSRAAQQVRAEFDARQVPAVEAAKRNRSPKPNKVTPIPDWKPAPGQADVQPCKFVGATEPGLPPDWLRCTYVCGGYEVELSDVFGSKSDDCKKWVHLERARREAENRARVKRDKER